MLYGTFASTHRCARSMMAARVVLGAAAPADGGPEAPVPRSGPFSPCGLAGAGSGSASPSARGAQGAWPAAAAAPAAPQERTTPAAGMFRPPPEVSSRQVCGPGMPSASLPFQPWACWNAWVARLSAVPHSGPGPTA